MPQSQSVWSRLLAFKQPVIEPRDAALLNQAKEVRREEGEGVEGVEGVERRGGKGREKGGNYVSP